MTDLTRRYSILLIALLLTPLWAADKAPANSWWPFGKDGQRQALKVDETPVSRDSAAPMITSFSPIVKKVSPSVVSIFTSKKVKPSSNRNFPMFNDPFFRRFFGDPNEGGNEEGAIPRQPQQQQPRMPEQTQTGLGSGVIVTSDGFILTNNHVIEVADEIKVQLGNSRRQYTAKLVGKDPMTDVALIKIDAPDLVPMTIADSDKIEVGDIVLAIGNPFGLAQTVTMGIISAVGRNEVGIETYEDFIQTDAAINPGNSGGALVDAQGRMIGLNTAIVGGRNGGNVGIGFAVPSNLVRYVMESLLKDGRVVRGYLGVNIDEVTPDLAEAFKLPEITGALVSQVNPGTAAAEAGFEAGDIVLEFNGKKIPNRSALRLLVGQTPPKTKCAVKVWRNGKEKSLEVTLKELTKEVLAQGQPGLKGEGEEKAEPEADTYLVAGVKVESLTPEARRQFNIPPEINGVIVRDIEGDSPALKPGAPSLQVGDVIIEVDKRPVKTTKEALDAAKGTKANVLLRVWSKGNTRFVVVPRK